MSTSRARAAKIAAALEGWFRKNQRTLPWRATYDPYHVWVSEVMLQQTRMEVVLPYFGRFLGRFPTVAALADAPVEDVLALWSGLGYYRRARMLHAGARSVVERFGGQLPATAPELMKIPGIGRYTAGAIASIAFNRPAPIVDGNVARVASRLEAMAEARGSAPFLDQAWSCAEALVRAAGSPRMLNQALMELGALVCTPRNPSCALCPAAAHCRALENDAVESFPVQPEKRPTVDLHVPLLLLTDDRGFVLLRRGEGRLMKGLYHLPHGTDALLGYADSFVPGRSLGEFSHTITHRRVRFELFAAEKSSSLADRPGEYRWVDPEDLADLPHPSYVRKALRLAAL